MANRYLTKVPVVAIDGPVGVGKSSVARRVAQEMGLRHLDTGAMYRALALKVMREHSERASLENMNLGAVARDLDLVFRPTGEVFLEGEDVSEKIRSEDLSQFVARIADRMDVRRAMVDQQRRLGLSQPSVLEGRDIGSVVFPDAACKVYLDASPKVRVKRRMDQLLAAGQEVTEDDVYTALSERDRRDRSREWGGLKIAEDALIFDTTSYREDFVVSTIGALIKNTREFESLSLSE